jgi:RIO kinase 1
LIEHAALEELRDEGLITDVLRPVGSGKEADVYLCRATPRRTEGARVAIAKVLRPRTHRDFRGASRYLDGRYRKRTSVVKAMEAGNRAGQEFRHSAWIEHEWQTLRALHAAGADVPRPIARTGTALLMANIGDDRAPAPQLRQVRLEPDEAAAALERLLLNVALFLLHNVVHGDLSAYNVLWWDGGPTVIDFPQAVDPRFHGAAEELLARDVANLCRSFERLGVHRDADAIAADLWTGFEFADLWVEPT